MLEELRIQALGVIDDATIRLGAGLTVVTGETGAGKTMVVNGLQLLFGARADSAQVRSGAVQAAVEGRVSATPKVAARVAEAGGELDDDHTLVLRRTVSSAGRSRSHAGGTSVPVGVLAELGEDLLTIHGQAGQRLLIQPAAQRAALDHYAGIDTAPYRRAFHAWQDAERRWQQLTRDAATLSAEAEVLEHALTEIERVDPQPGEDEQLAAVASRLGHVDALRVAARAAHDALVGADEPGARDADVQSLVGPAVQELARIADADPVLDELATRLGALSAEAADLGAELSSYESGLDADPDTLRRVEERRAELTALVRRYGRSADSDAGAGVAAVLDWAKRAAARHSEIDVSDEALAALQATKDSAHTLAAAEAADLSARRTAAARDLSAAVTTELAGLAMGGAQLLVTVRARPTVAGQPSVDLPDGPASAGTDGADEVEFGLRTDPAGPAVPLQRGASGGELSRVMLAVEVVLADTDPVPTMVFDEVDAGVGGRAGTEVGRRLARLALSRQVIVVTHLPQVAAYASHHLMVDRVAADPADPDGSAETAETAGSTAGVTSSAVHVLHATQREAELARMLAGSDTAAARQHAAELLAQAHADGEDRRQRPGRGAPGG